MDVLIIQEIGLAESLSFSSFSSFIDSTGRVKLSSSMYELSCPRFCSASRPLNHTLTSLVVIFLSSSVEFHSDNSIGELVKTFWLGSQVALWYKLEIQGTMVLRELRRRSQQPQFQGPFLKDNNRQGEIRTGFFHNLPIQRAK